MVACFASYLAKQLSVPCVRCFTAIPIGFPLHITRTLQTASLNSLSRSNELSGRIRGSQTSSGQGDAATHVGRVVTDPPHSRLVPLIHEAAGVMVSGRSPTTTIAWVAFLNRFPRPFRHEWPPLRRRRPPRVRFREPRRLGLVRDNVARQDRAGCGTRWLAYRSFRGEPPPRPHSRGASDSLDMTRHRRRFRTAARRPTPGSVAGG